MDRRSNAAVGGFLRRHQPWLSGGRRWGIRTGYATRLWHPGWGLSHPWRVWEGIADLPNRMRYPRSIFFTS